MKNIITLLSAIFLLSCSNDDTPGEPVVEDYYFTITIKQQCPSAESPEQKFCVTESVRDAVRQEVNVMRNNFPEMECFSVTFTDINGDQKNGFYIQSDMYTTNPCD